MTSASAAVLIVRGDGAFNPIALSLISPVASSTIALAWVFWSGRPLSTFPKAFFYVGVGIATLQYLLLPPCALHVIQEMQPRCIWYEITHASIPCSALSIVTG